MNDNEHNMILALHTLSDIALFVLMQQTLQMKLKPLHEKLRIYEDFKQSCLKTGEYIKVRA